jgi:cation transport ATPase
MIDKCECQQCGKFVEFEAAELERVSETPYHILGQSIDCPHCGNSTQLYIKRERVELAETRKSAMPKTSRWTIIIGTIFITALLAFFLWSAISNQNLSASLSMFGATFLFPAVIFCLIGFLFFAITIRLWLRLLAAGLLVIGAWFLILGLSNLNAVSNNQNGTIFQQQFFMLEIIGGGLLTGISILAFIALEVIKTKPK